MKSALVNKFDGGQAQDPRTTNKDESSSSQNFDIQTNPHRLLPIRDLILETISTGSGVITDFDITDVVACDISGTTYAIGWGRQDASNINPSFFQKASSTDITSAWAIKASGGATDPIPNTLVEYKKSAYALETIAGANLVRFTPASTYTTIGTLTGSTITSPSAVPKPFVHPEDNILYIGFGNSISKYDGSILTNSAIVLPTNMLITSLTNYGTYLAIACKPNNGVGNSIVYLWGRDTSLTTLQGLINWGDVGLEIIENINEVLVGVSSTKNIAGYTTVQTNKFTVSYYNGGQVNIIKEFTRDSTYILRNYKAKHNSNLYFGFDKDNAIWKCGKNKEGNYFVVQDSYYTTTGSSITGVLNGISLIGDILFSAYTDNSIGVYLARTTTTFANQSVYVTSVNPDMAELDRYMNKKLVSVRLAYELNSTNGTATLGYYNEDFSGTLAGTLQTVISDTKTALGQYTIKATNNSDGTPFLQGKEYIFRVGSTGDVRPKEIEYEYETIV